MILGLIKLNFSEEQLCTKNVLVLRRACASVLCVKNGDTQILVTVKKNLGTFDFFVRSCTDLYSAYRRLLIFS